MPVLVTRLSGSRFDTAPASPQVIRTLPIVVMAGLVPAIHDFFSFRGRPKNSWMRGPSPRMTTLWSFRQMEAQPISLNRTAVCLSRASTNFLPPKNTWTPGTSPGVTIMGRVRVAEDSPPLWVKREPDSRVKSTGMTISGANRTSVGSIVKHCGSHRHSLLHRRPLGRGRPSRGGSRGPSRPGAPGGRAGGSRTRACPRARASSANRPGAR